MRPIALLPCASYACAHGVQMQPDMVLEAVSQGMS